MTPGRPARTSEQIAETRAHIVSSALVLFRDEGYQGISMRRLAREAGCTPRTLYKYFDDKFEILQALWADVLGDAFDRLETVAAAATSPEKKLEAVALGYVQFWIENRDHYYLVFMSSGITQDDVTLFLGDERLVARFDLFRSCIADVLGEHAEPDDVQVRAEVLVCGLHGIAQGLVTMSGYPWAGPQQLVSGLLSGVAS